MTINHFWRKRVRSCWVLFIKQTNKDAFSFIICLLTPGLNSFHSKHTLQEVRSYSSSARAMWNMMGAPWWAMSVMLKLTPGIPWQVLWPTTQLCLVWRRVQGVQVSVACLLGVCLHLPKKKYKDRGTGWKWTKVPSQKRYESGHFTHPCKSIFFRNVSVCQNLKWPMIIMQLYKSTNVEFSGETCQLTNIQMRQRIKHSCRIRNCSCTVSSNLWLQPSHLFITSFGCESFNYVMFW